MVLLDAYQTAGSVPLDVRALGVEFLAAGALKYYCVPPRPAQPAKVRNYNTIMCLAAAVARSRSKEAEEAMRRPERLPAARAGLAVIVLRSVLARGEYDRTSRSVRSICPFSQG